MPKTIDEQKVFRVVMKILMSRGYDRATTKEIASRAGINEVTLFRKFGNKMGLFEQAILNQLEDTPLNHLEYTGSLALDLTKMVEAYIETNDLHGDIIPIILLELPRNPDLRGSIGVALNNLSLGIGIISQYQDQGLLKKEEPLATLGALFGPIMINKMMHRAHFNWPTPKIVPHEYVDSFLTGRQPDKNP